MLRAGRALGLTAALALVVGVCAAAAGASAQQPRTKRQQPAPPAATPAGEASKPPGGEAAGQQTPQTADAKPGYKLTVTKSGPVRSYKLVAKDANLTEVAAELSRQIDVPVRLSPLMQKQKVTVDFSGLDLDASLRFLAPHPVVDYVAGDDPGGQPQPLAVYLYAMNEQLPPLNETVKSNVETLLIEGHTEEGTEEYEKQKKAEPLEVKFENNRLSVRAEKQPLAVVLYKVASELGIPFELDRDPGEVADVNFQQLPVDQAMRTLSPSIRFFYRADLLNFEKYPIRIALGGAAGRGQGKN